MTTIAKGGNLTLDVTAVRAVLSWTTSPGIPDVDASAVVLGASGRVANDADFVFYNQPNHPGGAVRHLGKQPHPDGRSVADAVELDLAALPADVDRVALAASSDAGSFGQVPDLRLDVVDAASNAPIAQFVVGAGDETAIVTGELYRRNGQWKFRAVGQGYASGLAGLARDFGISVDDEPSAAPIPDVDAAPPLPQQTPPPLPPYDGPRPIPGQAYEPAPDGFAPPPPR